MSSDETTAASVPSSGGRPQTIYVLLDHDDFMSAHATWESANQAKQDFLDDVARPWLDVGQKPPRSSAEDALRIEAVEVQPGPDTETRNREMDRTRTLRIANGWLHRIHSSTLCLRPNGHCWIHDPSPIEVHPLRAAPVYLADSEVVYRACRHAEPGDADPAGTGLHPDPDWLAFADWAAERPVVAPHPCCEDWCCLPEPPTDEDHAQAQRLLQAARALAADFDLDPVTPDDERQTLQDCVLKRLERARTNPPTPQEP